MNQVKDFFEYIFNAVKIFIIIEPWQQGIRVRNGNKTKLLKKGIYFRLPYFDSVYVQEVRMRIMEVPIQTLTSKDIKTITLNSSVGYSINNIETLYKTLYHPEKTIYNIAQGVINSFIWDNDLKNITPEAIQEAVLNKLKETDYGITFESYLITNFAVVRTYRLIQENSYGWEGLEMNVKK